MGGFFLKLELNLKFRFAEFKFSLSICFLKKKKAKLALHLSVVLNVFSLLSLKAPMSSLVTSLLPRVSLC